MSRTILLFLTLVGCTASAGQRARTAGKGVVQVGLEGGAMHNPWSDAIAPHGSASPTFGSLFSSDHTLDCQTTRDPPMENPVNILGIPLGTSWEGIGTNCGQSIAEPDGKEILPRPCRGRPTIHPPIDPQG